ncbi:MAG: photosystem II stability/assembly factor-like uncharacterized protein [Alteromonadaceae bacterium]|jgi:photosystem II stability/assembly factor-like uncharacterized protein
MKKLITYSCVLLLSQFMLLTAQAGVTPAFMTPLASKSLLTDIVEVGDSVVAVGDRGHIVYSTDGDNWQQAKVPVNVLLTDVFFLDQNHGWAVGHDATILASVDGGKSWTVQQSAPEIDKPLFGIHFKDSSNGIAFGAYGMFYRTTDGGASWQDEFHGELLHPDDLAYINDLKANDPKGYKDETATILPHFNRLMTLGSTLYLVGETGMVAKSDDFGAHWNKAEPFYNGSFFTIDNGGTGGIFVGGLRGNLFYSHDFGQKDAPGSWKKLALAATTSINRIFSAVDKMVIVGNSGLFYTSHDGGKTFTSRVQSDGKAITAGVVKGSKLILTTEAGIKVIQGGKW